MALVAVFATGCGGGPRDVNGAAAPPAVQRSAEELLENPCVLLTDAEVTQVLGAPVQGVAENADGYYSTCEWEVPAQPGAYSSSVSLHYWPKGGKVVAADWKQNPANSPEPVALGDAAGWDPVTGLAVVVDDTQLTIAGYLAQPGSRNPLPKDTIIALAKLAAARAG
ncbi:DUF3558 family protein [Actinomycetes bacterium KLBMP 9759]